jgi:hypothetical protein
MSGPPTPEELARCGVRHAGMQFLPLPPIDMDKVREALANVDPVRAGARYARWRYAGRTALRVVRGWRR